MAGSRRNGGSGAIRSGVVSRFMRLSSVELQHPGIQVNRCPAAADPAGESAISEKTPQQASRSGIAHTNIVSSQSGFAKTECALLIYGLCRLPQNQPAAALRMPHDQFQPTATFIPRSPAPSLPGMRLHQLLNRRHPSAMCRSAGGSQTHAAGHESRQQSQRLTESCWSLALAADLPELSGNHACPQEVLHLRSPVCHR